jgi:hypothetical protein
MLTPAQYAWELGRAALGDRDGWLAVIRIYIDESGTHDGSPVVAVGAYAGRLETWPAFIEDWEKAKGPINVFHSADCGAYQGEFKGWKEEDRNALVAKLLAVLPRHELFGIAMGINLRDVKEATGAQPDLSSTPELAAFFDAPYGMCLQWTLQNIIERTEAVGIRKEPIAVFHEQNDFHAEAMAAFDFVKRRRVSHVGPMNIAFVEKDSHVPLQAADVLAYEANKRLRDPTRPQRRSIAALGDKISVEGFAKPNMPAFVANLREFITRRRRGRQGES